MSKNSSNGTQQSTSEPVVTNLTPEELTAAAQNNGSNGSSRSSKGSARRGAKPGAGAGGTPDENGAAADVAALAQFQIDSADQALGGMVETLAAAAEFQGAEIAALVLGYPKTVLAVAASEILGKLHTQGSSESLGKPQSQQQLASTLRLPQSRLGLIQQLQQRQPLPQQLKAAALLEEGE